MTRPVFHAEVPRHGDAFYLDVTYESGTKIRFAIDALTKLDAFYETAYVLENAGNARVSDAAVSGTLCTADGVEVATGSSQWFEARS